VVEPRFRRCLDARQAQRCQGRREPATDHVVDSPLARPGQPAFPKRPDRRRLSDTHGQEIRLNQQDRAAWSHARDAVRDGSPRVR